MAFDIKAAPPDASFDWSTAGLFGADSQAATDPSYFSASVVRTALLALANIWAAKQTITPLVNTEGLTISGYSLTGANAQSALDISGTWNTSGTPTLLKVNVTDTASNAAALLVDLRVGGASRFSVSKAGALNGPTDANMFSIATVRFSGAISIDSLFGSSGAVLFNGVNSAVGLSLASDFPMSWSSSAAVGVGVSYTPLNTVDLQLRRDAADTLAQRRGTNAQTLRWYHTFTDPSNRQNGALKTAAGYVEIAAETAGTGAANVDVRLTPVGTGNVDFPGGTLLKTRAALTDGSAAALGTLANAPVAGNPTKWISINDNGTTRQIPAW